MGEVYRARDVRLSRDVAIKVLPPLFASDPERVSRFEREAQVLATLNHPNIGAIYGLIDTDADGRRVVGLVLELIEGRTLDQVIPSTGLPLDEALNFGAQIADALAAAHAAGIVHRDLKPGNVIVTPGGVAKVLDFGLAKAMGSDAVFDLTVTSAPAPARTEEGVVMGTACYMSPEQAAGRAVDARSDVFSFGSVLFEMVTGRRAFDSDTPISTLAKIIHEPPVAVTEVNAAVPRELERLIARCHRKDPARRVQSMADLRSALEDLRADLASRRGSGAIAAAPPLPAPRRASVPLIASTAAIIALAAGLLAGRAWFGRASAPAEAMRLDIVTPPAQDLLSIAVSPDGRRIVFSGVSNGESRLWIRSLASGDTQPIAGSERGTLPFWSPDSRSLAFFADSRLYRIDIDAGSRQAITAAPLPMGGAWSRDGVIVFARLGSRLQQVPATGGIAAPIRGIAPLHAGHFAPAFLPDGRHFLYYVRGDAATRGIYVGGFGDEPSRRLFDANRGAIYTNGRLLFVRAGTAFAVPFDPDRLTAGDTPVPIAQGGLERLSASDTGIVAFRNTESAGVGYRGYPESFEKVDRSGRAVPLDAQGSSPALSPDGRFVAVHRSQEGNVDVWLFDTARGTVSRFTSDPADDVMGIWSPDGKQIVFSSNRGGVPDLYIKALGGSEERRLLTTPAGKFATDWSRDGRLIAFTSSDPATGLDILGIAPDGHGDPVPIVRTAFDETDAQFSPDGKWIAFMSNETGRPEVWVQPFPGPGTKTRISTNGGSQPRWRPDGRELFYVGLDERLMGTPVTLDAATGSCEPGTPQPIYQLRLAEAVPERQQYVVMPDGAHFFARINAPSAAETAKNGSLGILLNWESLLK